MVGVMLLNWHGYPMLLTLNENNQIILVNDNVIHDQDENLIVIF